MVTESDLERERHEARLKFRREQNALLRDARMEGEELGEKRAWKRAIFFGRIQLGEEFLKQEPTPEEALRTLSLDQLQELADPPAPAAGKRLPVGER